MKRISFNVIKSKDINVKGICFNFFDDNNFVDLDNQQVIEAYTNIRNNIKLRKSSSDDLVSFFEEELDLTSILDLFGGK